MYIFIVNFKYVQNTNKCVLETLHNFTRHLYFRLKLFQRIMLNSSKEQNDHQDNQ